MKKLLCMIAIAAISFGSVYAYEITPAKAGVAQQDTTRKKTKKKGEKPKKKTKRDTTKKDTMSRM